MTSSPTTRVRRFSLALALGVLVIFALHLQAWHFLCDDAYISFRYARNLAETGLPVYNLDPLERVEGYSNPGWVLLLAGFAFVGVEPQFSAPWLCGLTAALSLLLCVGLLRASLTTSVEAQARPEPRPPLFREAELYAAPLVLALTPEFVVWGSGGLEGAANLCAGLAACLLAIRDRWRAAAVAALICLFIRPDAAFWLIWPTGIAASRWLSRQVQDPEEGAAAMTREARVRELAVALAIVALPLIAHVLWRKSFYGEWLPNTWEVKRHGIELRQSWGLDYLRAWAFDAGFIWLAPSLLLLRRSSLPWLLAALASLTWGWWVGGDFMAYGRFLLPATTFAALYVGASLIVLRESIESRGGPWRVVALVVCALALVQLWRVPRRIERDHEQAWIDKKWESVDGMHRFAAVRVAAGAAWAQRLPADTWASVGAAGAMPYSSRFGVFDSFGLVDPGVAADPRSLIKKGARPGHVVHAPLDYIKARRPDLMCHIGHAGPKQPSRSSARRRAGKGWEWACVETGPIQDRRAPQGLWPSQFYCCLAPSGSDNAGTGEPRNAEANRAAGR